MFFSSALANIVGYYMLITIDLPYFLVDSIILLVSFEMSSSTDLLLCSISFIKYSCYCLQPFIFFKRFYLSLLPIVESGLFPQSIHQFGLSTHRSSVISVLLCYGLIPYSSIWCVILSFIICVHLVLVGSLHYLLLHFLLII